VNSSACWLLVSVSKVAIGDVIHRNDDDKSGFPGPVHDGILATMWDLTLSTRRRWQ